MEEKKRKRENGPQAGPKSDVLDMQLIKRAKMKNGQVEKVEKYKNEIFTIGIKGITFSWS